MKEGLISLAFFHASITAINALTKKRLSNVVRGALMLVLCTGFFSWQASQYVQTREPNYFEILELSSSTPTPLTVKKSYQKLMNRIAEESKSGEAGSSVLIEDKEEGKPGKEQAKKAKKSRKKKKKARTEMTAEELGIDDRKRKLREIYDCLMFSQCYQQYSKYGSYIPLEMIGQQFDLRIAQLFVFYLIFSLISGALSSERQGKGVSFARAVAIVFLMNELELVFNYQQQMDSMSGKESPDEAGLGGGEGGAFQQKTRIDFINSLFSPTWCLYEKIHTQRLLYLFVFNVACTLADVFFEDKFAKEMEDMKQCVRNQKKIVELSKKVFKRYNNDEQEYRRKPLGTKTAPMNKIRAEQMKENNLEFAQVRSGQSLRFVKLKANLWRGVRMIVTLVLLFFAAKNQVLPYLSRYFGVWKTIL